MKIFILFLVIHLSAACYSQGFKLFLIGDTGEDEILGPTMENLLDTISRYTNSAVIFLGDNCYNKGLLGQLGGFNNKKYTIARMDAQLNGLKNSGYKGSIYFIPGNHDWFNKTNMKKGKRHLKLEENFIKSSFTDNPIIQKVSVSFLPSDGKPIAAVEVNNGKLKLIFIDTQWLIIQKSDEERERVYFQLDSIINKAISDNQKIVVAGHHPLYTIAKHSKKGSIPLKQFKNQNIYHHSYKDMREKIDSIFIHKNKYPIIYASGHDHVLEYFRKDSVQYIVSGSGSKTSTYNKKHVFNPNPKSEIPEERIAKCAEGFFELDYSGKEVVVKMLALEIPMKSEVIKN